MLTCLREAVNDLREAVNDLWEAVNDLREAVNDLREAVNRSGVKCSYCRCFMRASRSSWIFFHCAF